MFIHIEYTQRFITATYLNRCKELNKNKLIKRNFKDNHPEYGKKNKSDWQFVFHRLIRISKSILV